MIHAVAFDLDDTLFLERDYVRSGFYAVARHLHERVDAGFDWEERLWAGFTAGVRGRAFDQVLEAAGVRPSPELIADLVRVYREHRPDVAPLPDVTATLERLALPPERVGVITDGPPIMQRRKFEALGIERFVGHLIVTDEWGVEFRKPHPRAFETFERLSGCPGGYCAYVGDNPAKDFQAPHARGWTAIRVRRPGGLHCDVETLFGETDAVVERLDELLTIVRGEKD